MFLNIVGGLLFVSGLLFSAVAAVAWYRIQSPAIDLFAVVAATAGIGATILSGGVLAERPVLVLFTAILFGLGLPLPWVFFSFDYVGRESLVSLWVAAVVSIPLAVGLFSTVLIFGGQRLPWLQLPTQQDATGLSAVFVSVLDLSQFFGLLYAGGLVLVGTGLLLWTFQRYRHLDSTTGIMLGSFGTVPWVSILCGLQLQPVSFVAFIVTITGGFALGALSGVALVGPYPLFDRVPTAGNVGPKTLIEELDEMIIVADGKGTVVEVNAAAVQSVQPTQAIVGSSVEELFGASLDELEQKQVLDLRTGSGRRLFEPSVSELTDQHGQPLGYAVVLRDVTVRMTRQQRLDVFNRIFRHNLKNDMTVIVSHAQLVQSRTDDDSIEESADIIVEKVGDLIDISESTRDIERVLDFEAKSQRHTALEPVVRTVLDSVASQHEGSFQYEGHTDVTAPVTEEALQMALEELVENAVKHNERENPLVRVEVGHEPDRPYPIHLSVIDNGPGIPEQERRAIEAGSETSLEHASGIGLWTVRWIANRLGGELSFSTRDPHGSVVSLSLPGTDELRDSSEKVEL